MDDFLDPNAFEDEDFDEDFDDEDVEILTLTDEETSEDIEFIVVDRVVHEGAVYCLLVELMGGEDDEDDDAQPYAAIFKEQKGENGEPDSYTPIDDEDEFETVAALFDEIHEDDDFDLDGFGEDDFDEDDALGE